MVARSPASILRIRISSASLPSSFIVGHWIPRDANKDLCLLPAILKIVVRHKHVYLCTTTQKRNGRHHVLRLILTTKCDHLAITIMNNNVSLFLWSSKITRCSLNLFFEWKATFQGKPQEHVITFWLLFLCWQNNHRRDTWQSRGKLNANISFAFIVLRSMKIALLPSRV